ncbi:MAG: hypothetical protein KGS60_10235 [Verrucomicrobia bacterium]|nr:hypothetical protein [Verrucomicrobiota bacterium]
MTAEKGILGALAQANDEQATQIFHDSLRRVVRVGPMNTMAAEVEMLCGPGRFSSTTAKRRSPGPGCGRMAAGLLRAQSGWRSWPSRCARRHPGLHTGVAAE